MLIGTGLRQIHVMELGAVAPERPHRCYHDPAMCAARLMRLAGHLLTVDELIMCLLKR